MPFAPAVLQGKSKIPNETSAKQISWQDPPFALDKLQSPLALFRRILLVV
jgi:hypothetical protein